MSITSNTNFDWKCINTRKQSANNTLWCLIGCSIGDFGTIIYFQVNKSRFERINYYDTGNYQWYID